MIELEDPRWRRWRGVYVDDVSPLLRRLHTGEDSFEEVWNNVYHQSCYEPVCYAALPYMVQFLRQVDPGGHEVDVTCVGTIVAEFWLLDRRTESDGERVLARSVALDDDVVRAVEAAVRDYQALAWSSLEALGAADYADRLYDLSNVAAAHRLPRLHHALEEFARNGVGCGKCGDGISAPAYADSARRLGRTDPIRLRLQAVPAAGVEDQIRDAPLDANWASLRESLAPGCAASFASLGNVISAAERAAPSDPRRLPPLLLAGEILACLDLFSADEHFPDAARSAMSSAPRLRAAAYATLVARTWPEVERTQIFAVLTAAVALPRAYFAVRFFSETRVECPKCRDTFYAPRHGDA